MKTLTLPLVLAMLAVGCKKETPCPAKYGELADAVKSAGGECACPAGVPSGTVWGSGIYTTDSSVCGSAIHAGAIDSSKGGTVAFKPAAGCKRYTGSAKNGVTSAKWGAWGGSFVFPGHGEGACPAGVPDECPATFLAIANADTVTTFSCTCAGDASGAVYGTGVYTRDSSLCAAAVHSGAAPAAGGKITVRPAAGCAKYAGSAANGVTSSGWGAYPNSFFFEGHGDGTCAAQ